MIHTGYARLELRKKKRTTKASKSEHFRASNYSASRNRNWRGRTNVTGSGHAKGPTDVFIDCNRYHPSRDFLPKARFEWLERFLLTITLKILLQYERCEQFLNGLSRKKTLKNRARFERFWAVYPKKPPKRSKPVKSCWKTAQTAHILSDFWAGSRPGQWTRMVIPVEVQGERALSLNKTQHEGNWTVHEMVQEQPRNKHKRKKSISKTKKNYVKCRMYGHKGDWT